MKQSFTEQYSKYYPVFINGSIGVCFISSPGFVHGRYKNSPIMIMDSPVTIYAVSHDGFMGGAVKDRDILTAIYTGKISHPQLPSASLATAIRNKAYSILCEYHGEYMVKEGHSISYDPKVGSMEPKKDDQSKENNSVEQKPGKDPSFIETLFKHLSVPKEGLLGVYSKDETTVAVVDASHMEGGRPSFWPIPGLDAVLRELPVDLIHKKFIGRTDSLIDIIKTGEVLYESTTWHGTVKECLENEPDKGLPPSERDGRGNLREEPRRPVLDRLNELRAELVNNQIAELESRDTQNMLLAMIDAMIKNHSSVTESDFVSLESILISKKKVTPEEHPEVFGILEDLTALAEKVKEYSPVSGEWIDKQTLYLSKEIIEVLRKKLGIN